jgi:hypothetical protein
VVDSSETTYREDGGSEYRNGSGRQFALMIPCRGIDFSLGTREAAENWNGRLDRRGYCGGCGAIPGLI